MHSRHIAHVGIQIIARRVLSDLGPTIKATDTERSIAQRATEMLEDRGVSQTWYHECPALVLLGSTSTLSVSGRTYIPGKEPVGSLNLVTIDVSPCQDDIWGDCARSYPIENGRMTSSPVTQEFQAGLDMERAMHDLLMSLATPETTFSELHEAASSHLAQNGYENLDFFSNYGHSIATRLEDRIYVSADNHEPLGSVEYFTYEPHIRARGSAWGFKHEDIYYFDSRGRVRAL